MWVAAALAVGALGCSFRDERQPPENVIIIVLDALRADRLGCYGHAAGRSPTIDSLAAEGVLFENAIAQCCFTPPAMASLLTGRHVPSHGLLGWEARLPEPEITLAEVLHDAGYRTAAFVFLNLLTRQGLGQGFEEGAEMVEPADSVFALARWWIQDRVIDGRPMGAASAAGSTGAAPPFFLLLHCYDVHRPYTPRAPYDTMFGTEYGGTIDGTNETLSAIQEGRITLAPEDHAHLADLYDGEIRYIDDRVGEFLRWLGERRLLDETLIVVTADHGETLGERALLAAAGALDGPPGSAAASSTSDAGAQRSSSPLAAASGAFDRGSLPLQYTHDESLYDPVMKIPLILRAPRALPKGVRIARQVRQIDIMPTILALLGVESPPSVEGEALLAVGGAPASMGVRDARDARGAGADSASAAARPVFADAYPEPTRPNRYMRALRTPRAKLIHNIHEGTWERYDLATDPAEERNLWPETGDALDARVRSDSLASQLLAHAVGSGEVEEICLVWEDGAPGGRSGAFTGELSVSGGKILGVSQPPGQTDTEHEVSADGTRLTFGGAGGSRAARAPAAATRKALWVRIDSPRLTAKLSARDAAGGALPIHTYLRGDDLEGEASFMPANIGHAYIDPFLEKTRGVHVFGRSRLEKQRIPISLDPEEIERLRALGYVGG
jgi:arylsulfatase A-like enzyme